MPGRSTHHRERHRSERIGWLRAAVLGANDGIVSTASLVLGVAAAQPDARGVLLAGGAGLIAGAMSMAAGEYVSVHTQADTEAADLAKEKLEIETDAAAEERELTGIYVQRGLERGLAQQVAQQLMAHDALGAHARDELGISATTAAKPLQAAMASAASFATGAALPLAAAAAAPVASMIPWVAVASLVFLAGLGALSGQGRRRTCGDRHAACHRVGCIGDGRHRGHRQAGGHGDLTAGAAASLPHLALWGRRRCRGGASASTQVQRRPCRCMDEAGAGARFAARAPP